MPPWTDPLQGPRHFHAILLNRPDGFCPGETWNVAQSRVVRAVHDPRLPRVRGSLWPVGLQAVIDIPPRTVVLVGEEPGCEEECHGAYDIRLFDQSVITMAGLINAMNHSPQYKNAEFRCLVGRSHRRLCLVTLDEVIAAGRWLLTDFGPEYAFTGVISVLTP